MLFVVYRTFLHVTPFVRPIRTTSSQKADVKILTFINSKCMFLTMVPQIHGIMNRYHYISLTSININKLSNAMSS